MPPPSPVRTPEGPAWLRVWHVLTLVAVLAFGVVVTGVLAFTGGTGTMAGGAASTFEDAPAVKASVTHVRGDGSTTNGSFTVSQEGYASGTVSDPGAGAATMRSTPDGVAVFADQDWWTRREPSLVGEVEDRWILPKSSGEFPVQLNQLEPQNLASLIDEIERNGEPAKVDGRDDVRLTVHGDWSLLTSAKRVLAVTGPVDSGRLRPSVGSGGAAGPAPYTGGGSAGPVRDTGDGMVSISPEPEDSGAAGKAKSQASDAMSGKAGTPGGASASASPSEAAKPVEPPRPDDIAKPDFDVSINAGNCSTPTCSWTATASNSGDAPGDASLTASVSPGMGPQTTNLGEIPPGGSETTPTMSFPNPAKPGGGSVPIDHQVWLYSVQLDGPSKKQNKYLRKKDWTEENVRAVLDQVAEPLKAGMQEAMYRLTKEGLGPSEVAEVLEFADDHGLLNQVLKFGDAGKRFSGWGAVPLKLGHNAKNKDTFADEYGIKGYREEMELAAAKLDASKDTEVKLEGVAESDGEKLGSDLLVKDGSDKVAVQAKLVTNKAVVKAVNAAVEQLSGKKWSEQEGYEKRGKNDGIRQQAPPGYDRHAYVYVKTKEGGRGNLAGMSKADFEARFNSAGKQLRICDDELHFDRLLIQNERSKRDGDGGYFVWTRKDLCGD